jgi:hypothetical protein
MRLFMYVAVYALLGLLVTIVWLLAVGVDDERWRQRAAQAASSVWT